jgi:hypothetical protein
MIADMAAGDATTRGAVRFFWVWLILATGVSVAGNVAHAVLTAPSATVRLAAAAAVVPPAVLLGSTHSVALLVKARRVGFIYWCALAMTIALAGCAFVLSFDALRDLAVALGMRPDRAWLWPVAIDVSIANSTLSLLSLSSRRGPTARSGAADTARQESAKMRPRQAVSGPTPAEDLPSAPTRNRGSARPATGGRPGDGRQQAGAPVPASPEASARTLAAVPHAAAAPVGAAAHARWTPLADKLVRSGVTSKDPAVVAAVLADHAAGTPPGTIGRRHKVHHSTVGRILAGAEGLTG